MVMCPDSGSAVLGGFTGRANGRCSPHGLVAGQCRFAGRIIGSAAESCAAGAVPGGHSGLSAPEHDSGRRC